MTEADERPLRVIAADDHAIVRAGISAVLAVKPDMLLVAAVATAAEAIAAAAEHNPDVVVMDLQLPDLDGAAATRRLLADRPGTAVLMLTMHDDEESVINAVRAGARGYLVKGASNADIAAAIRAVARGEAVFGAQLAQRLLDSVAGRSPVPLPELTDRERDVPAAPRRRPRHERGGPPAVPQPEDHPQQRLQHRRQAGCRGPGPRDRPGAGRRTARRLDFGGWASASRTRNRATGPGSRIRWRGPGRRWCTWPGGCRISR
jgi:DNA-binding NarL/FixJ family response regulator